MVFKLLSLILTLGLISTTLQANQPLRRAARMIPARSSSSLSHPEDSIQNPSTFNPNPSSFNLEPSSEEPINPSSEYPSSFSPEPSSEEPSSFSPDFSSENPSSFSPEPSSDSPVNPFNPPIITNRCQFGYIHVKSDKGDCFKVDCITPRDCEIIFGANSTCETSTRTCKCDTTHKFDPITGKCLKISGINHPCHDSYDCMDVPNSYCNTQDGECECRGGYSDVNGECVRGTCYFNNQCQAILGQGGKCNDNNHCECMNNYQLNPKTQKCDTQLKPVNSFCLNDYQCGQSSYCVNNQCKCQISTIPNPTTNNIDCKSWNCNYDYECTAKTANTKCNQFNKNCECNEDNGYTSDSSTQSCKLKAKKISDFCSFDSDCGTNARCISSFCKCKSGYSKDTNQIDCKLQTCNFNSDCHTSDWNSNCYGGFCDCKGGYSVDYFSQTCTKDFYGWDNDDYSSATAFSAIGLISVSSIIIAVIIVLIRAKAAAQRGQGRVINNRPRPTTAIVTSTAKVTLPQKS